MRCVCRDRIIIFEKRGEYAMCEVSVAYFIVDVGDVHNKMNVVPEVIYQDPSDDILCYVVPVW
jgi:hypothetical protein